MSLADMLMSPEKEILKYTSDCIDGWKSSYTEKLMETYDELRNKRLFDFEKYLHCYEDDYQEEINKLGEFCEGSNNLDKDTNERRRMIYPAS